jgi:hypothetical protein
MDLNKKILQLKSLLRSLETEVDTKTEISDSSADSVLTTYSADKIEEDFVKKDGTTPINYSSGSQKIGDITGGNYFEVEDDGTIKLIGEATTFDDLRIDSLSWRSGAISPSVDTGFAGDADHTVINFVHTQADEIQFPVQLPHSWKEGSTVFPHFHYAVYPTVADGTYNVRFILEFYYADIGESFLTNAKQTFIITGTFTSVSNNKRYVHAIAENLTGVSMTNFKISNVWNCRLYRDNTVANNFPGKISGLYFDIHFEVDSTGSNEEYIK